MIWKEHPIFTAVLALLLAANVFFFFTYRVQYETRLKDAEARLQQSEAALAKARGSRVAAEQQLASYFRVQHELEDLYNKRWATQQERLTALILEVKRLTAASNMIPTMYTFTGGEETNKERKRPGSIGTSTVGIVFMVQGDYQQVRRLINLLELSDQFVIIDAIALAGSPNDPKLTLNLQLKTVFREPAETPSTLAHKEL